MFSGYTSGFALWGGHCDNFSVSNRICSLFFCLHFLYLYVVVQVSQTQCTRGPLEAVFGCGRAAIGIPQKSSEVFSSAHINMKWLLMCRNRGVHETSVFWPSTDKGQV